MKGGLFDIRVAELQLFLISEQESWNHGGELNGGYKKAG